MEIYSHNLSPQDYDMWPFIGLRDLLRIERTSFYGYGGYVYEIVDKESSGIIVVIQVSYYLTETSMLWLLWLSWLLIAI